MKFDQCWAEKSDFDKAGFRSIVLTLLILIKIGQNWRFLLVSKFFLTSRDIFWGFKFQTMLRNPVPKKNSRIVQSWRILAVLELKYSHFWIWRTCTWSTSDWNVSSVPTAPNSVAAPQFPTYPLFRLGPYLHSYRRFWTEHFWRTNRFVDRGCWGMTWNGRFVEAPRRLCERLGRTGNWGKIGAKLGEDWGEIGRKNFFFQFFFIFFFAMLCVFSHQKNVFKFQKILIRD